MEFFKSFEHFSVGGGSYTINGMGNLNGDNFNVKAYNDKKAKLKKYKLHFNGIGFALYGKAENAVISVEIDGETINDSISVDNAEEYSELYKYTDIEKGSHELIITAISGNISLDSIAVYTDNTEKYRLIPLVKKEKNAPINKSDIKKAAAVAVTGIAAVMIHKIADKKRK